MAKPGQRKPMVLTVHRLFEPSRLAPHCLAEAYERVLPTKRRVTRAGRTTHDTLAAGSTRQAGGMRG
jgi:hypothetical protein